MLKLKFIIILFPAVILMPTETKKNSGSRVKAYSNHGWEIVVLLEIASFFSLNGNKTFKSCENFVQRILVSYSAHTLSHACLPSMRTGCGEYCHVLSQRGICQSVLNSCAHVI